jgi:hypothetical protein
MKAYRTVVVGLSLIGIIFGFSTQASAGAGQPPGALASCQLPRQSGTPVGGIGQVMVSTPDVNGFAQVLIQMTLSHKGTVFTFSATLPAVQVVNGSILDAICAMLVAPGTVNGIDGTLNDQIVAALGFKNRNVMITSDSIQGSACIDPTAPKCQTLNNPSGITFTGDLFAGTLTGTGTFTLYVQP